jgi:polyisoprenoid-binding protein YceI
VAAGAPQAPRWEIDHAASRLAFTAEQAGAEFEGTFEEFEADVRFSPDAIASSHALVRVTAASAETQNEERDGYLRGDGWFEADEYPDVVWEAERFEALGDDRYRAIGNLRVRDLTVEVPFDFEVERNGASIVLEGTTKLDRLALGLGLGDWANTEWVGKDVVVNVKLVARLDTTAP